MVAYNFTSQFSASVETHQKRQTIRAIGKKRHAILGEALQLYTGMRTKKSRKLVTPDPICIEVEPFGISTSFQVFIGNGSGIKLLTGEQAKEVAIADGFDSTEAFFSFIRDAYGLPFTGVLIKW